ncbi:MAG TPA: carbonic anhydrase family protein [Bryobacteraceae bacterium]|nr:carbonic anhydrase family protein [Bryobacteraceae bacterium]
MLAALAMITAPAAAQWKVPWSYEGARGPDHWAELDPSYAPCAGKQQSPVDIRATEKADLPPLGFEYHSAPLRYLTNNGKTIRVNYHDHVSAGALMVDGKRYELTQFHFHHPSEEQLNGQSFPMVVHLMHQSADSKVVGVAVMVVAGAANETVAKVWEHMPATEGAEHQIPGVDVDPTALIPQSLGYYSYEGSVTAPPCTERVTWFILKTPVSLSQKQIDAFAKLFPNDVRPVQPLNGRVIKESR